MMTMSATQMARQAIPIRRVVINHESEMPLDYGTTPGGTMFGTTPGGTRIVYERNFLLQMRQSPLSHTPPSNLPKIPGVTAPKENKTNNNNNKAGNSPNDNKNVSFSAKTANGGAALRGSSPPKSNRVPASIKEEEEQFSMDM